MSKDLVLLKEILVIRSHAALDSVGCCNFHIMAMVLAPTPNLNVEYAIKLKFV